MLYPAWAWVDNTAIYPTTKDSTDNHTVSQSATLVFTGTPLIYFLQVNT